MYISSLFVLIVVALTIVQVLIIFGLVCFIVTLCVVMTTEPILLHGRVVKLNNKKDRDM